MDRIAYDALVIVTPEDYKRTSCMHKRLVEYLPVRNLLVIAREECRALIEEEGIEGIGFLDENSILSFDRVEKVFQEHIKEYLDGEKLPRRVIGWYYQQFLKLEYAKKCHDEYYMTWDGDTIPCRTFSMFNEDGQPYLDLKHEYEEIYFVTMNRLIPDLKKVISRSFISEHLLFDCNIVKEMLEEIESNHTIDGDTWWEKVIHCIPPEDVMHSAFSEFETYGTYVALRHVNAYKLRSWNSFRLAAYFLKPEEMNQTTWDWLAKDFYALSFEKNLEIREDYANIFDNPKYQEKLSARQVLEICQEEYDAGYKEVWD